MYRMHPPCNLHSAALSSSRTRTDHLRSAARLLVRHLLNCGALLQPTPTYTDAREPRKLPVGRLSVLCPLPTRRRRRRRALCMQPGHSGSSACGLRVQQFNNNNNTISVSGELSKAAAKGFTQLASLLPRRGNSFSGIKFNCCCLPGRVRGDIRIESGRQQPNAECKVNFMWSWINIIIISAITLCESTVFGSAGIMQIAIS